MATEVPEADLLTLHGWEGAVAVGRSEETVIGKHGAVDTHVAVVAHQE